MNPNETNLQAQSPNHRKKSPVSDFYNRSLLYQSYLAEKEEILRHKWIESEKAGEDIGFERALLDWVRHHRSAWRKEQSRLKTPQLSE